MAGNLNGRVRRLEATLKPPADRCRACGLRHASGPMTLAVLRSIIRVAGGTRHGRPGRRRRCACATRAAAIPGTAGWPGSATASTPPDGCGDLQMPR